MARNVKGKALRGSYLPLILLVLFLVAVWAFGNIQAGNAYAEGFLTPADLTLCANNDITDTADCLLFLTNSKQKDHSVFLAGTDKGFQDLYNWFTSLGGSS